MNVRLISVACVVVATCVAAMGSSSTNAAGTLGPKNLTIIDRPLNVQPAWRENLKEMRPALPGYRAAILDQSEGPWPLELPDGERAEVQGAAEMVGKRLAIDGLLLTTAQAIEIIGPQKFIQDETAATRMLRDAGLPVDWLVYFRLPGESQTGGVLTYLADLIAGGRPAATLGPEIEACVFDFVPTRAGFQLASESGEHEIAAIRLQLTRGGYWECEGDGGNLDLARQLIAQVPDAHFIINLERRFMDEFLALLSTWPKADQVRITVIPEDFTVSQWAQDNGKSGLIVSDSSSSTPTATIVPRFASRGEDGSTFVPGESFVAEGLAAAGMDVFQSPLMFQGGDVLAVHSPQRGERLLFVGEGDVSRNMALGLTEAQVLAAMRSEFGVHRVIKLPAISFHIDFELSVRAHDGKLIAFVIDTPAAVRLVLETAVAILANSGKLDAQAAAAAIEHLRNGRTDQFMQIVGGAIWSNADADGHFPLSFAKLFSAGPGDSGVGNLQRVLLALDLLVSQAVNPASLGLDRHSQAYLESFVRQAADRKALRELLAAEGFEVVPVPGISDGDRGINPLNGIHDRSRYLMPAYGGMFAPVDAAAASIFERTLGPGVAVTPILSGETQRRSGGVHCSASVLPKAEP